MASFLAHTTFIAVIFVWPFILILGAILGLLYRLRPFWLLDSFSRYGAYILIGAPTSSMKIRGMELKYFVRNPRAASPTLLLVHGFSAAKVTLIPLIKAFPKSWKVVAMDLPGHGESEFSEEESYTCAGMVGILNEFVENLGLEEIHLVGESLGSLYCAHYATYHPEKVLSVTLMCPPGMHRIGAKETEFMKSIDSNESLDSSQANLLFPTNAAELREMLQLFLLKPEKLYFHDRMMEAIVVLRSKKYPSLRRVLHDVVKSHEQIREQFENISAPCQLLWGKQDKVCDVSGAKVFKSIKKDARVFVLDHCGHAISVEQPKRCALLIKNLISQGH